MIAMGGITSLRTLKTLKLHSTHSLISEGLAYPLSHCWHIGPLCPFLQLSEMFISEELKEIEFNSKQVKAGEHLTISEEFEFARQ
jgi:hypothetical protein